MDNTRKVWRQLFCNTAMVKEEAGMPTTLTAVLQHANASWIKHTAVGELTPAERRQEVAAMLRERVLIIKGHRGFYKKVGDTLPRSVMGLSCRFAGDRPTLRATVALRRCQMRGRKPRELEAN